MGYLRAPEVVIPKSNQDFAKAFEKTSDGLLKGLDWSNVFIAGGIVLGTMMSVSKDGHADLWRSSDMDLYIYGLTRESANEKIKHIFEVFSNNLPKGAEPLLVRNSQTITLFAKYPLRRIQIILKLVKSPRSVLLNFDLDVCAMGWDGETVWILPRAARALESMCPIYSNT